MQTVSIVVPVYKSADSLKEIAEAVNEENKKQNYFAELIFVNDSPNHKPTQQVLGDLEERYDFVRSIVLRKNQGQHIALVVGMHYSTGKYVITMDDDLQHPAEEVPNLIVAMCSDDSIDAIFAIPDFKARKHSFWRNLGSYMLSKLDNLFQKKPDGLVKSSFRIMKKEIANYIVNNFHAMPSVSSMIINYTHSIKNITVSHHRRKYGKSNYSKRKLISLTLNNFINYSSLPLKIVGAVGFASFLFAILFVSITIIRNLFFGLSYPGYTSIITLTGILGGLNLLSVGIIGEYLIRILKHVQKPKIQDIVLKD